MHEYALIQNLLSKVQAVAESEHARTVVSITIRLGPRAHVTPAFFREQFLQVASGTVAAGARVDVEKADRPFEDLPGAVLERIEVM